LDRDPACDKKMFQASPRDRQPVGWEVETADQSEFFAGFHVGTDRVADDLFKLAIEASPSGVLVLGPGGTIVLVNRALEQQFGYSSNDLIGQPVEVLLPESLRSVHAGQRLSYLKNPQSRPMGSGREIGLNAIQTTTGLFVLASVVDISERRRNEEEQLEALNKRQEFERLVAELSARFVNLEAEQIDDAIVEAQRCIAQALDLDRASLFQLSDDKNDFVLTHYWVASGGRVPPSYVSAKEHFPWSLDRIRNGEPAVFSSVEEVPDAVERETLRQYGTKARIAFPLSIDGRVLGVIAFASTREARPWPQETISHLNLVAQVFGSALARKRAEAALRASEERFRTLADNAPVMIWVSGPDKLFTWFNRRWLEFVGQTMEHELANGWADSVHPNDVESCLPVYAKAFDARETFSMEYRLRRADGVWRWILNKGTPNYAAGEFQGYIGSCVDVTEQKQAQELLEGAFAEVRNLRDKLQSENVYLRREVEERLGSGPIVGNSAAVRHVLDQIRQVAGTDSTVLLLGETGTGKELFATQIHEQSARRGHTMVRVNCAAIPATLIESELFGREKGAFTGALARQIGRFELADHSTIFLDEIGDLPVEVQVKLLRVLEERQIERLGSTKGIRVDTRIIAATHRNIEQRIAEGEFREDLYYRLNVFPIHIPPLRDRVEDIPMLVWRFIGEFSKSFGKPIEAVSRENMAALQAYPWPGNIRELRNVVERAMIVATGMRLHIPLPTSSTAKKHYVALNDVEREHIRHVLESTGWRIRGSGGAAVRLGLKPTTLETRMAKLGLSRPR
jgi:formate hydrogenlyase transcriptional activator